jgi:DNA ligase (NAD+)
MAPIDKLILNVGEYMTYSVDQLANVITHLNNHYYNGDEPLVSDEVYDIIYDRLRTLDPKNKHFTIVGAKKGKVVLPFYMSSLAKIKSDNSTLNTFKTKFPGTYVVSDKLDGVSALYDSKAKKLYTRGDGKVGQDISNLLLYIQGIPKSVKEDVVVRGELILTKAAFENIKGDNANARNTVSGIVNAKKPNVDIAKRIKFVAYSMFQPSGLDADTQMKMMSKKYGFDTVWNNTLKQLDFEDLSSQLDTRRRLSDYDIDGIVIMHNSPNHKLVEEKVPTYAFAFKHLLTQKTAEVIVTDVEWNVSKDGLLKPTVLFDAVNLSGVNIRRATGFNAHFIESNKIGMGAVIVITRSGDVIPFIMSVVSPAKAPKMPTIPYVWSGSKDIKVIGKSTGQDLKEILHFVTSIGVPGMGPGMVKKIFDAGYASVFELLNVDQGNFLKIPGFANKNELYVALHSAVEKASCVTLMQASNKFGSGFGERKLNSIIKVDPGILDPSYPAPTIESLCQIEGIQKTTAEKFIVGLVKYREFLKVTGIDCIKTKPSKPSKKSVKPKPSKMKKRKMSDDHDTHDVDNVSDDGNVSDDESNDVDNSIEIEKKQTLKGHSVLFTGLRDAALLQEIMSRGGITDENKPDRKKLIPTIIICKDPNSNSKKMMDATANGAVAMTREDFVKQYIV